MQADKVLIYVEHKKIGCTSVFTQTHYFCINPSLLGRWIGLNLVWLTSGSWEKWNDLGEACLLPHGSPKLDCAESTRKEVKMGIQGENKPVLHPSGWHASQILGSGPVMWNDSFNRQEKIAEKSVLSKLSSVIACHIPLNNCFYF